MIDGQHRYKALEQLLELGVNNVAISCVTVEVIQVSNETSLFAEFQTINKSVPVPTHKLWVNSVVEESVVLLVTKFPKALKSKRLSPALYF